MTDHHVRTRDGLFVPVLAAALLLVGLGIVIGTGIIRPPEFAADPTPSSAASSTGSPSADPSASPDASTTAPSPAPGGIWAADSLVQTTVDALIIRADAGLGGERLGTLANGATSIVVHGPVPADGYEWYLVSALGLPPAAGCGPGISREPYNCPDWFGWVAAAALVGELWLAPASAECIEPPAEELVELTSNHPHFEMLHCYGGRDLTFRAWWPEQASEANWYCDPAADVQWLGCPSVELGWDPGYPEAIGVAVHPENGPPFPERGQWISVTAHLDDPESASCGSAADATTAELQAILGCRAHLVVTAVEPAPAP